MAAGLIPFVRHRQRTLFLFQRPFGGRKRGYLVDFGGGGEAGESYADTAIREFVEETETMYFEPDLALAQRTPERIVAQCRLLQRYLARTLYSHPEWRCRREPGNGYPPKDWISFFVELPYRDIQEMNREWLNDRSGRFKKPRELHWVEGGELLRIYREEPGRLWKRVRQLQGAGDVISGILAGHEVP